MYVDYHFLSIMSEGQEQKLRKFEFMQKVSTWMLTFVV